MGLKTGAIHFSAPPCPLTPPLSHAQSQGLQSFMACKLINRDPLPPRFTHCMDTFQYERKTSRGKTAVTTFLVCLGRGVEGGGGIARPNLFVRLMFLSGKRRSCIIFLVYSFRLTHPPVLFILASTAISQSVCRFYLGAVTGHASSRLVG